MRVLLLTVIGLAMTLWVAGAIYVLVSPRPFRPDHVIRRAEPDNPLNGDRADTECSAALAETPMMLDPFDPYEARGGVWPTGMIFRR